MTKINGRHLKRKRVALSSALTNFVLFSCRHAHVKCEKKTTENQQVLMTPQNEKTVKTHAFTKYFHVISHYDVQYTHHAKKRHRQGRYVLFLKQNVLLEQKRC